MDSTADVGRSEIVELYFSLPLEARDAAMSYIKSIQITPRKTGLALSGLESSQQAFPPESDPPPA
jgi:hypothetical protein